MTSDSITAVMRGTTAEKFAALLRLAGYTGNAYEADTESDWNAIDDLIDQCVNQVLNFIPILHVQIEPATYHRWPNRWMRNGDSVDTEQTEALDASYHASKPGPTIADFLHPDESVLIAILRMQNNVPPDSDRIDFSNIRREITPKGQSMDEIFLELCDPLDQQDSANGKSSIRNCQQGT
jgi:hypothetical protein